jgi:hypothetical protein
MRRTIALALGTVLLAASVPVVVAGTYPAGQGDRRITTFPAAPAPAGAATPAGMTTVIVTMRAQADPGSMPGATRAARRQGIIRALQAQAATTQRALVRYLDDERARGGGAGPTPGSTRTASTRPRPWT